MSPKVSPVN
jgi:arsenite methyltransferase